jgi:hypothetical protein
VLEPVSSSEVSFLGVVNTKFVVAFLNAEDGEIKSLSYCELAISKEASVTTFLLAEPFGVSWGSWPLVV